MVEVTPGQGAQPALNERTLVGWALRLAGMLAAARRVHNVDQMPVMELDEGAGTVELNLNLLMKQFGLSATGQ